MDIRCFIKPVSVIVMSLCMAHAVYAAQVTPLGEGVYPVASTNMQLQKEHMGLSGEELDAYLIGNRSLFSSDYVSDLLAYPNSAWLIDVNIPDNDTMYGPLSGDTLPLLSYVTFPTSVSAAAQGYAFPYHDSAYGQFIHMLKPDEQPQFADPSQRYPLVVLSHGSMAHGIYDIGHANRLASHGYIVAVVFYGDGRNRSRFGDNSAAPFLRALMTGAVIDSLVESDMFGDHIDADNIAVSGHSYGGFTALAMAGGHIQGNPQSVSDNRVNAVVLAAPWTGTKHQDGEVFAFGPSNKGLDHIDVPTLCAFGTADTVTTADTILPAIKRLAGPTYVVELVDQPHVFEGGSWEDRDNWELVFLNAYLKGESEALNLLKHGSSMAGGNDDKQLFEYQRTAVQRTPLASR